jgi:hypothetical protein
MLKCCITVTFRWWVYLLIELAKFNALIGIPVDLECLGQIIVVHGLKIKIRAA